MKRYPQSASIILVRLLRCFAGLLIFAGKVFCKTGLVSMNCSIKRILAPPKEAPEVGEST
jgi:hypothetical protein